MAMVTIDPSVPETPPGSGIKWDSANQTWVDTKNGYTPWNSGTQSWGAKQSPPPDAPPLGAQYTQAQIDLINAQAGTTILQGRNDTTNAAANTSNAATNAANATNTAARNQQLHEEMLASQGLTAQQIANNYAHDKATYGIDKATLLLNARQAQAKSLLDNANFALNQNTVNAQARQKLGDQQLTALQMLQDRKGPQDWTRWDYITGMGGNQPTPIDSKTYSPLDMLAAQYQPSNINAPAPFDANGIDAGAYPDAAPTTIAPGGGAGSPASVPTMANPGQPATNFHPAGQPATIAPQGQPATVAPIGASNPLPNNGGNNPNPFGGGINGGSMSGNWQPTVAGIPPSGLPHEAQGGTAPGGAAVVGDQKSGKPTHHEEVAYASNNPKTGVAELHVIPHHMLGSLIDKATGRHDGIVMHGNKVPKEMAHLLPRAYDGGSFDGSDVGGNPQGDAQPDSGQAQGDVPQYQPLNARQGGGGDWMNSTSAGGVPQFQQQTMENRNVSQTGAYASAAQTAAGGFAADPNVMRMQPDPNAGMKSEAYWRAIPPGDRGFYLPGEAGYGTGTAPPSPPHPNGSGQVAQPTIQPQVPGNGLNTSPINVQGGVNYGGTAAPPPQALGPAGYDPYRITQNKYGAGTMNDSPVLRMIRGQQPVYGFQGQGNYKPGIESQGITDLPTNLNYADLMHMDPNRISMLKGVYDNPETGESWDSVFNAAKNAAPRTSNIGVARAR